MASILTVLDGSTQTGNVLDLSPSTTTWTVSGYTYRDTGRLHAHTQHGLVPWFRLLRHSTAWPTAPTRRRHQAWPRPARCPSPRPPTSAYATSPTSRAGASRIGLHLPHANVHLDTTAHTSPVQDVRRRPPPRLLRLLRRGQECQLLRCRQRRRRQPPLRGQSRLLRAVPITHRLIRPRDHMATGGAAHR